MDGVDDNYADGEKRVADTFFTNYQLTPTIERALQGMVRSIDLIE